MKHQTFKRLFQAVLVLVFAAVQVGCSKQSRADKHVRNADAYFEAGDYDRARIEYAGALRLDPTRARAIAQLGRIYLDQGALLQAAPLLNKAKELDPRNPEVRSRMAVIYSALGDLKNATAEAFTTLDLTPDNEMAVLLLAELPDQPNEAQNLQQRLAPYRAKAGDRPVFHVVDALRLGRQKDWVGAEAAAQRALALDPKCAPASFILGNMYWARTNLAGAEAMLKSAASNSPSRSARRLRWIEFLLADGKAGEAKSSLSQLVREAPDYLPALLLQATIAADEGRNDEALTQCELLLGRYGAYLEAQLLRGRLLMLKGQPEKVLSSLEPLLKFYPKSPQLRFQLALAYLLTKEEAKALSSLEQALQVDATMPEPCLLLAQLRLAKGDYDGAVGLLTRLLKARPGVERAYLILGEAHASKGRFAEAAAAYAELAKAFPKDPRGPLLSGLLWRQQGRPAEARRAFEASVQLEPKFVPAHAQLLELELASTNLDAAARRAQALVESSPEDAGARLLVARVQLARRNTQAAEAALKKALELDSSSAQAYLALAGIYREGKRLDASLRQLESLLEKNPKDITALMLKATLLAEQGKYEKARDTYENLLAVNPNFSPALNNLAYLYCEQLPDLRKAWTYARRARELLPNAGAAADTLGWVHYRRGEYADALRLLLEAAERLPGQPEIQYHVGMAYYMMAQEGPAKVALERAAKASEEFNGKDEAKRRLEMLSGNPKGREARQQLEQAVRAQPNDVLALVGLGQIYAREGSVEQASKAFEDALKVNPDLPVPVLHLARVAASRPDGRDQCVRLLRRVRELAFGDPDLLRQAGQIAASVGDAALATSLLQEAARKLGETPDIHLDLAEAAYLAGRIDEAGALAAKARADGKGAVAQQAQQLEWLVQAWRNPAAAAAQAEPQLQALLKASPQRVPVIMAMAGVDENKGRHPSARDAYEKVLDRLPDFAPARRALAMLYAGPLKDDKKAMEHAVKARELLPADPGVAKTLGVLSLRKGDFRYAAQLLTEASRTLAEDGEVFFSLGMAQRQLKKNKEAADSLKRAIQLGPQAPYATEATRALADLK